MINLLIFGPPGSGKGTQSEKLINKYGFIHISTGDIFRKAFRTKTKLGIEARGYIEKGELVPDHVVIGMMSEELEKHTTSKGFIFDGFPRTTIQAEALDRILDKNNNEITLMISLEVEEKELITRLVKRAEISGRCDDQNISVIKNRLDVYKKTTQALIDYYKEANKYIAVEGTGSIDEIYSRIDKIVNKLF
ncbi:adenylate kinase [Bacteroidota bacterium]